MAQVAHKFSPCLWPLRKVGPPQSASCFLLPMSCQWSRAMPVPLMPPPSALKRRDTKHNHNIVFSCGIVLTATHKSGAWYAEEESEEVKARGMVKGASRRIAEAQQGETRGHKDFEADETHCGCVTAAGAEAWHWAWASAVRDLMCLARV